MIHIEGGQKKYDIIDYLKGFSIITIVVMHLLQGRDIPSVCQKVISLGGTGVHIFFFCSGFGLFLSQKRKTLTYKEFIIKRLSKIYIPYIIAVICIAFIPFTFDGTLINRIRALCSHIFLYKMFIPKYEVSFAYQLWYMSTLFQFYFLFIFMYWIKEKIGNKKYILISVVISVLWWILTAKFGISDQRIWGSFFLQYLWEFSIGMYVADYLNDNNDIDLKISRVCILTVIGLLVGGLLGIKGGALKAFNDFFMVVGYLGTALIIYNFLPFYRRICEKVNIFSFEWYLLHMTCFGIIFRLKLNNICLLIIQTIVAMIISVVVAWIYHRILMKIVKRR